MMISPETYKEEHKDNSLIELIIERKRIYNSIKKYEEENILNVDKKQNIEDIIIMNPSSEAIYKCSNQYLIEITRLIDDKLNKEIL